MRFRKPLRKLCKVVAAPYRRLTPRRVDALLLVFVAMAGTTGVLSWGVGSGWGRWITVIHGISGMALVALAPAKMAGSVRSGLRRKRKSGWLSVVMAALVVATVSLGVLHSTGLWYGVGYWSALWTHVLAAAVVVFLVVWHVLSRPSRLRTADLDRRAVAGGSVALLTAAAVYGTQELVIGGNRRFTGSHEIASLSPRDMPTVVWLNDRAPAAEVASQSHITIANEQVSIDSLAERTQPLLAELDCTGGWWSRQSWDVVPLEVLLAESGVRPGKASLEVTSLTGYSRIFPARDVGNLYLAVGYGGEKLRLGHGAPVRLVAPFRRGYWWVKWVTSIHPTNRHWLLQWPFPLE